MKNKKLPALTISRFICEWFDGPRHQRLGQAFVNKYLEGPYPELFYEEDNQIAVIMIWEYAK